MPVTATLRELPKEKGYHASQSAKDNAKKYFDIEELPEGWTFVSSGRREIKVRINPENGQPYVRNIIFQGKETQQEKLIRMINEINSGKKPSR